MSEKANLQPISDQALAQQPSPTDSHTQHNSLLSAAAAVLTQSTHLREGWSGSSVLGLQSQLVELIEQFMHDGQEKHYPAPILLASRYFLCASLDELITYSAWVKKNEWEQHALLSFFKQEPRESDRFFLILQRACENPADHIDLIELGFHCLSIGFMGEYKNQPNGLETIAKLMDKLYQIIVETRGEAPSELFLGPAPSIKVKTKRFSWACNKRWAAYIWGGCIVLYLIILFPYKAKLADFSAPIEQTLKTLTKTTG
jgi:type IV/VI secretion system ImpK/VasF family protein